MILRTALPADEVVAVHHDAAIIEHNDRVRRRRVLYARGVRWLLDEHASARWDRVRSRWVSKSREIA